MKNNIKELLNKKGLKISWLCQQTGINASKMSRLISGDQDISLQDAVNISTALQTGIFEVFPTFDEK